MNNHVYDLLKWSLLSGGNGDGEKINNQDKTITENGTYTADDGYTGLGTVVVNVASGGEEEVNVVKEIIEGTITELSSDVAETVRDQAFIGCDSLKKVDLPNATYIDSYAFHECEGLIMVNIPKVEKVGQYVFSGCKALVSADLPNLTSSGQSTFQNCTALQTASIPKMTSIVHSMFNSCKSLISIDSPVAKNVVSYAFKDCISLKTANFPNITIIYSEAFKGCLALESVDITSITSIGNNAFENDSELIIVRLPATPPALYNVNAFSNINAACVFYIPTGSLSAYQEATNWSALTSQYTFTEEDR